MTDECEVCVTDHPKARKTHRCDECGGVIQVGEAYAKHHGVFDGQGFTHKICSDCTALIEKLNAGKRFEDIVYFGGLYEFSYEHGLKEWKAFLEIKKKRGAKISESTLITLKEWEEEEMKTKSEVSWRRGMDNTSHAIIGCDPMASAWIAVCGVLITGRKEKPNDFRCPVCRRDLKAVNDQTQEN